MSRRFLALCLALALSLSLIPAAVFADEPLYTYQETGTGVKATGVFMMGNGLGTFKTVDGSGTTVSKGVIDPSGKVILTRTPKSDEGMMAGNATNNTIYNGVGSAIVDMQRVMRYAKDGDAKLSDTQGEGMNSYVDLAIYDTSGKRKAYVTDIVARTEGLGVTEFFVDPTFYYGSDGYLTVFASGFENNTVAYIIDPQTLQVVFQHETDAGMPTVKSEGWTITSVNDGLIAYNHSSTDWNADETDIETTFISAGWMDINGNHKLSVDTGKYSNWWNFSDGMAAVANMTGLWYGYIDKTGKEVVPCIYADFGSFKEGYAYVKNEDGGVGYIDKTGKEVIPLHYDDAFGHGEGLFTVGSGGRYGMVDVNDNVVVPLTYSDISVAKNGIAYAVKDGEVVILTFSGSASGGAGGPYDFTPAADGAGSYKADETSWSWGDRANLPKDVAALYNTLDAGSASGSFLTAGDTWILPKSDTGTANYPVDTVQVCEDHEPVYLANGDGKVDESTFGNSAFYTVAAAAGDAKIDYPNLTTGDVVSNTSFNGVFVTKLQKTNNASFDTDLATLKSDVIASFRAFELDHPEVFWLTGSVKLRVLTVTIQNVQTSYIFITLADSSGFCMRMENYAETGAIEAAIKTRDDAAAAILAEIPANGTVREKIAALNKWLTMHNEYNRSTDLSTIGYLPHRSLAALTGNEGTSGPVCDGYSRAFKLICDRLEIPCILDTGMATSGTHSEYHMWNRVRIDDVWYGMDCTWDDPIVKGVSGKVSGYENEKYLLVGNETEVDGMKFGVSHAAKETAGGTTGVLFASLTISGTSAGNVENIFKDVPAGAWYAKFLQKAYDNSIVGGMSVDKYGPSNNLTHAQIMVMVANLHSLQKGDGFKASSVAGDHWAASFRDYCKAEGIIDERFDGKLDAQITRGEMAYYFANALTVESYQDKKDASLTDIAGNPYEAEIQRLAKADIVGGYSDGSFKAGNLVTRAEASVFVSNIIDAMK